jgi:hypothetical protein
MDEHKDKIIICPKCKSDNSKDDLLDSFDGFYDGAEVKVLCSCGYEITVILRMDSWFSVKQ